MAFLIIHQSTTDFQVLSAHGVMFVKYASVLLQALTVQIDEAFLYAVLDLTKLEGVSWETDTDRRVVTFSSKVCI